MFTGGGAPSEVHGYFSPFGTPTDAFITCQSAVMDFEMRLRAFTVTAKDPFRFYQGVGKKMFTGMTALSLKGFIDVISQVKRKSIEFHKKRGDFEKWAKFSLQNKKLASHFRKIRKSKLKGEPLKIAIKQAAEKCFEDVRNKTLVLGYY
jgi:alpha-amylase